MSQIPPVVAITTHPSQNKTSDTLKLLAHASVEDCWEPHCRRPALEFDCQLAEHESSNITERDSVSISFCQLLLKRRQENENRALD